METVHMEAHAERGEKISKVYTGRPEGRKEQLYTEHAKAQEGEKAGRYTQPGTVAEKDGPQPLSYTAELYLARSRKVVKQGEKPTAPR